jgi:hypothetical protein
MKRNMFIGSIASLVAFLPLLAKAEDRMSGGLRATNLDALAWSNPSWFCGSAVVWLDTSSGVYFHKGQSQYGRTTRGAYACEKHAIEAGNRAS